MAQRPALPSYPPPSFPLSRESRSHCLNKPSTAGKAPDSGISRNNGRAAMTAGREFQRAAAGFAIIPAPSSRIPAAPSFPRKRESTSHCPKKPSIARKSLDSRFCGNDGRVAVAAGQYDDKAGISMEQRPTLPSYLPPLDPPPSFIPYPVIPAKAGIHRPLPQATAAHYRKSPGFPLSRVGRPGV